MFPFTQSAPELAWEKRWFNQKGLSPSAWPCSRLSRLSVCANEQPRQPPLVQKPVLETPLKSSEQRSMASCALS